MLSKVLRLVKARLWAAQAECGFGQKRCVLHYTTRSHNYLCSTGHVHYYYIWYLRPLQEQLLFEESQLQALKKMPQAEKEPLPSQSQLELEPRSEC